MSPTSRPSQPRPRLNETDLLHRFIERTPFRLPNVRVYRRNIIDHHCAIDGRHVHLRNGIPGQADAYALARGGRHVEIETKAARGRLADAQKDWQAWCASWGVPHLVLRARGGEEPNATVDRWIEELREVLGG